MANKFFEAIKQHADKLEITLNEDNESICSVMFDMGEGRSQRVIICHHPSKDGSNDLVEISSAVLDLASMPDNKIGLEMATKLLRENDASLCANWAIDKGSDSCHLVATARWWLDEMDTEEFEVSLFNVALMADQLESTLGVDNF